MIDTLPTLLRRVFRYTPVPPPSRAPNEITHKNVPLSMFFHASRQSPSFLIPYGAEKKKLRALSLIEKTVRDC